MRRLLTALLALAVAGTAACTGSGKQAGPYGAQIAGLGAALTLLGWEMKLSNLRWQGDTVLIDVAARAPDPDAPHAKPEELRFGVYGSPAHTIEATGIGSCDPLLDMTPQPLAARDNRLTGTVCVGTLKERSAARGIYAYSTADRIADSTVAYGAAFPIGVAPTNPGETGGLTLTTTGVTAWHADGSPLSQLSLGDPAAFTGNGFMLLALTADSAVAKYRDAAMARGGPLMLVAAPSAPLPGLNPGCAEAGSSALILPDASLNSVHVSATLCTHGEINSALLYASVSVIGTHAAVWTNRG